MLLLVVVLLAAQVVAETMPEMPDIGEFKAPPIPEPVNSAVLLGDLVDSLTHLPASAIHTKDKTVKALAKTVFSTAAAGIEKIQEGDPMLSGTMKEISHEHLGLSAGQLHDLKHSEAHLKAIEADYNPNQIPAEVVFAMKKETMKKVDSDGDGLLSQAEVSAQLMRIMPTVDKMDGLKKKQEELHLLTDIMHHLDKDKDKELSKSEVFPDAPKDKVHAKLQDMQFKLADENHDSKLNEGEFFLFNHPEYSDNKEAYFSLKAEDHMASMDTNHDGKVSWNEFKNGYGTQSATSAAMPSVKHVFDLADSNKDSSLSFDEMRVMERNKMKQSLQKESADIIKTADDNHDGKLSLSEIINHTESFSGKFSDWMSDPDVLMFEVKGLARADETHSLSAFTRTP